MLAFLARVGGNQLHRENDQNQDIAVTNKAVFPVKQTPASSEGRENIIKENANLQELFNGLCIDKEN